MMTLFVSIMTIGRHLLNYKRPTEQRHIIRILFTPFIFGLFSFLSLCFYETAEYLGPLAGLYEVFAVVAIFLLFLAYVSPDPAEYATTFTNLERRTSIKQTTIHGDGSLRWFNVIWVMVFQIMPVHFVTSIVGWILQAAMCPTDPLLRNVSITIQVVQSLSTIMSLLAIICFYRRLQVPLKARRSLSKFTTFKVIISITLTQGPIFAGLNDGGIFKATKYVSYEGWSVGVPSLCICCEMLLFSMAFALPFSAKEYAQLDLESEKPGQGAEPRMNLSSAIFDAMNIWPVVRGTFFLGTVIAVLRRKKAAAVDEKQDMVYELSAERPSTSSSSIRRSASLEMQWTVVDLRKIDVS